MVDRVLRVLPLAILALASPARAQEDWHCTYPGYPDNKPVIVRFYLQAGALKEDMFIFNGEPVVRDFVVVQNNEFSIVGIDSISEVEPGHSVPSIGATLVTISRRDGRFLQTISYLGDEHNGFVEGDCIAD